MKLEEARKLACKGPYDTWDGPVDEYTRALGIHCYKHFDAVVAALEAIVADLRHNVGNRTTMAEYGEEVLARAKEVKTS